MDSRIYFGYVYDENGNRVPTKMSMMELGFVPTFYQFVDTIIEVKISITIQAPTEATNSVAQTTTDVANRAAYTYQYSGNWWYGGAASASVSRGTTVTTSQVNAGYAAATTTAWRIEPAAHQARTGAAPAGIEDPHSPIDAARGAVQAGSSTEAKKNVITLVK